MLRVLGEDDQREVITNSKPSGEVTNLAQKGQDRLMASDKNLNIRIPADLLEAIRKAAESENRTISNWILTACLNTLKKEWK